MSESSKAMTDKAEDGAAVERAILTWRERAASDPTYWNKSSPVRFMQAEIAELRAALKAQPAPTEAQEVHAPAARMAECKAYLATLAQGEDSARLDAVHDVLAERRRQIEQENWTPAHDDEYKSFELNRAAASYISFGANEPPSIWPWSRQWWKPDTYRRNMVKAGALIIAEIERIDRARASAETGRVKS